MEIFIKASQFLLSLSLLIVLHEFGHYLPAKLFKTRVEKFYLFFDAWGKKLFSFTKGGTEYGIGWLPLGGYVKISGMIDESMDLEQLEKDPEPWEFRSKPAWQRLIIMLGGVFVNFVLGIFIYIMILFTWGEKFLPNDSVVDGIWAQDELAIDIGLKTGDKILTVDGEKIKEYRSLTMEFINGNSYTIERDGEIINKTIPIDFISKLIEKPKDERSFISLRIPFAIGQVSENSINKDSQLKPKDIITAINGTSIKYFDEAESILLLNKNQDVTATILRGDETINIPLSIDENGKIGVQLGGLKNEDLERLGYYKLSTVKYSFLEAIPAGFKKTGKTLSSYIKQFKKIFNPKTGAYKGVGGFISIGSIFPPVWDAQVFWSITAFLSIMLGFMNLLPIPALDGGHVLFTLWEMITGRKPSDKFLEYAQIGGFIFLMGLLLLANGNDIYKWITGQL